MFRIIILHTYLSRAKMLHAHGLANLHSLKTSMVGIQKCMISVVGLNQKTLAMSLKFHVLNIVQNGAGEPKCPKTTFRAAIEGMSWPRMWCVGLINTTTVTLRLLANTLIGTVVGWIMYIFGPIFEIYSLHAWSTVGFIFCVILSKIRLNQVSYSQYSNTSYVCAR